MLNRFDHTQALRSAREKFEIVDYIAKPINRSHPLGFRCRTLVMEQRIDGES